MLGRLVSGLPSLRLDLGLRTNVDGDWIVDGMVPLGTERTNMVVDRFGYLSTYLVGSGSWVGEVIYGIYIWID